MRRGRWWRVSAAVVGAVLGLAGTAPAPAHADTGETVGYAVFDRATNTFTAQSNATMRFRSASVVKLLIALDYLMSHQGKPTSDDESDMESMLRSSDDDAAKKFWDADGTVDVVNRMVGRLGLQDTAPPPVAHHDYWGYTAISAADTVRIYRYVLDSAPAAVRDYLMSQLRQSTRCAADQMDQSFGIRSAFASPSAVKQGWSGFGRRGDCDGNPADSTTSAPDFSIPGLDLVRPALHTTGTVGADRSIVAVFTLQPVGRSFGAASSRLTAITRGLSVPGATPVDGTWFGTWASRVKVRAAPSTSAAVVGTLPAGIEVAVRCQVAGELVVAEGYRNEWWAYLPERGGYMTNIYITSPDNKLPGVPACPETSDRGR